MRYYMAMGAFILILLCVAVTLVIQGLYSAYFYLPIKELKRRSSRSKPAYHNLQEVAKLQTVADVFFKTIIFIAAVATVIMICRRYEPIIALVLLAACMAAWKAVKAFGPPHFIGLAGQLAPYLVAILRILQPIVEPVENIILHKRSARRHTDIYDKHDLIEMLHTQKVAPNNHIDHRDIEQAIQALHASERLIRNCMTQREEIHFVTTKDPIGPILLSELHKSGYKCFPVKGNGKHEIVGMLHIDDLVEHTEGGVVADAMDSHVAYLRDDWPLVSVARAFRTTGRHVFIVVNHQSEVTGLITIDDLFEELLGDNLNGEFSDFSDMQAVAADKKPETE